MSLTQKKFKKTLEPYLNEPFYEHEELAFVQALLDLFDFKNIALKESDLEHVDTIEVSDSNSEKYVANIRIPSLQTMVRLKATLEADYVFSLDLITAYDKDSLIGEDNAKNKLLHLLQVAKEEENGFWESDDYQLKSALFEFLEFHLDRGFHDEFGQEIFGKKDFIVFHEEISGYNHEEIETIVHVPTFQLSLTFKTINKGYECIYHLEDISSLETEIDDSLITNINGTPSILFTFDSAAHDLAVYAVPVTVAKQLNLMHYDHKELSGHEAFFSQIRPYELSYLYTYNTD